MARRSRRTGTLVALLLWGMALAGCQLTPAPGLVACPHPVAEQAAMVLKVTPLGTPREEAMKRLKEAGIHGNFGENQSIFYCDWWQRSPSERWHLNVVLMFDEHGRLYQTRPSPAEADKTPGVQHISSATADPFE